MSLANRTIDLASKQVLVAADGTAAAPSITNDGDTNTGMFFPAADTIGFSGGGNELMRIDSSGRVGIGTTTPGVKLHISSGSADAQMRIESTGGASYDQSIHFKDTASDWYIGNKYSGATNSFGVGRTQAKDDLVIDSSGNVGIGTASPSDILHVSKANGVSIFESTGVSSVGIRLRTNSTDRWQIGCPSASADLAIYTGAAATERLRITSGGNVEIGATGKNAKLLVQSEAGNSQCVYFIHDTELEDVLSIASTPTSGNNMFIQFYTEANAATSRGYIDYNRGSSVVRYSTTSDETLKNIIGDSSGEESVNILKNTKIRDFTWKSDTTNKVNVGVIAQELYNVFKGAVSVGGDIVKKDSDGNDVTTYQPWGVDKTAFTFHLVAGWQAHEKLIQELKAENDNLKARIEALEAA